MESLNNKTGNGNTKFNSNVIIEEIGDSGLYENLDTSLDSTLDKGLEDSMLKTLNTTVIKDNSKQSLPPHQTPLDSKKKKQNSDPILDVFNEYKKDSSKKESNETNKKEGIFNRLKGGNKTKDDDKKETKPSKTTNIFSIPVIILMGIIVILIVIIIWIIRRKMGKTDVLIDDLQKQVKDYQETYETMKKESAKKDTKIKMLEDSNSELMKKLDKQHSELTNLKIKNEEIGSKPESFKPKSYQELKKERFNKSNAYSINEPSAIETKIDSTNDQNITIDMSKEIKKNKEKSEHNSEDSLDDQSYVAGLLNN